MPLTAGTRFGDYEIVAPLGAGGMGEVYRARDIRLKREVAIKVLPAAFSRDPDHMARFQREAEVLASLNHPNIAAIHGLAEQDGVRALVMELVEGPTLAGRLAVRAIPIEEGLDIARQIAEALEAAHEKGIIHRDLKPANVKVTCEGVVKVLDFGLAKHEQGTAASADRTESPTETVATRIGVLMGTAAYMAPEQARGQEADKRADIWSFGAALYEMLSGKRAFPGRTTSDMLASVLKSEPDWSALPASTPPSIVHLLRRCLTKDRKQRLQAIGEARIAIANSLAHPEDDAAPKTPAPRAAWYRVLAWGVAGLVLGVLLVGVLFQIERPSAPSVRVRRLSIALAPGQYNSFDAPDLALSPDGNQLVYSVVENGKTRLYLRPLDQFEAKPIPGTEGAMVPFFAPEGGWRGFFAEGNLKKVALPGGPAQTLCSGPFSERGLGGSWSPDGSIFFQGRRGLFRVASSGGKCEELATPDLAKGDKALGWPEILPDGESLLFSVYRGFDFDTAALAVLSLKTGKWQTLGQQGTNPSYIAGRDVPRGYIVYAKAESLVVVPFDLAHLTIAGPPIPVLDGVLTDEWYGNARFAVSRDGTLAYITGGRGQAPRQVMLVSQNGTAQVLTPNEGAYEDLALSPDGRRIALTVQGPTWTIWIYDIPRATLTRFTFDNDAGDPCWTPDGKRLVYGSFRGGEYGLYWKPVDGSAPEELLLSSTNLLFPTSVAPAGKELAYFEHSAESGGAKQISILPLQGHHRPRPFLTATYNVAMPEFSPDGHWLAYQSDESGRSEVYVQQYPGPGGKLQISNQGGAIPLWSRDGRQLFYRNDEKLMAVPISTKPAFSAGVPRLLFQGAYFVSYHHYDVMPDGKQFVFIKQVDTAHGAPQINVVLNWVEELKQRVSSDKRR